jgi:hypothetical protein
MPFYMSEWVGSGTREDPFIAVGADQPGFGCIDLRPQANLAGGNCLIKTSVPFTDARARFLADDKLESLTSVQKNFLTNRLGIDLTSETILQDIIAAIMMRPPANGWKPLQAVRSNMRHEIWLGGELVWEKQATLGPQGELIDPTDNFNRANETPLASPWTIIFGPGANLVSNQASGAGDSMVAYTSSVSSADQFSQVVIPFASTQFVAPACRCSNVAGGGDAYVVLMGGFHSFGKFVNGTFSNLTATGTGEVDGATCRLEVEGSSLRYYQDTVLSPSSPYTDTSVTAVGLAGMSFGASGDTMDDWEGGDLNEPPAGITFNLVPPQFY